MLRQVRRTRPKCAHGCPKVLVSFVATAFMVLLMVWAKYLIAFDPGRNPFPSAAGLGSGGLGAAAKTTTTTMATTPCTSWHAKVVDDKFLGFVRPASARLAARLPGFLDTFRRLDLEPVLDEVRLTMPTLSRRGSRYPCVLSSVHVRCARVH